MKKKRNKYYKHLSYVGETIKAAKARIKMKKKIKAFAWVNKEGEFQRVPVLNSYLRIALEKSTNAELINNQKNIGFEQVEVVIEIL